MENLLFSSTPLLQNGDLKKLTVVLFIHDCILDLTLENRVQRGQMYLKILSYKRERLLSNISKDNLEALFQRAMSEMV